MVQEEDYTPDYQYHLRYTINTSCHCHPEEHEIEAYGSTIPELVKNYIKVCVQENHSPKTFSRIYEDIKYERELSQKERELLDHELTAQYNDYERQAKAAMEQKDRATKLRNLQTQLQTCKGEFERLQPDLNTHGMAARLQVIYDLERQIKELSSASSIG